MIPSTLEKTYTDLITDLAMSDGQGRTIGSLSAGELAFLQSILKDGLARFYGAYDWSFLQVPFAMTVFDVIDVGVVSVTTGTSGSNSSVVLGKLLPTSIIGKWFNAGEPESTTTRQILDITACTLAAGSLTGSTTIIVASSAFNTGTPENMKIYGMDDPLDVQSVVTGNGRSGLVTNSYFLPDNFDSLVGPMFLYSESNRNMGQVQFYDHTSYLETRNRTFGETGVPRFVTISPWVPQTISRNSFVDGTIFTSPAQGSDRQRWRMYVWPLPDGVYSLHGKYRVNPNTVSSTNPYVWGSPMHHQTIRAACMVELFSFRRDTTGLSIWEPRYQMALADSMKRDAKTAPHSYGYNSDGSILFGDSRYIGPNVPPNLVVTTP